MNEIFQFGNHNRSVSGQWEALKNDSPLRDRFEAVFVSRVSEKDNSHECDEEGCCDASWAVFEYIPTRLKTHNGDVVKVDELDSGLKALVEDRRVKVGICMDHLLERFAELDA